MGFAIIPNQAELNILNRWIAGADSIEIRLFVNNVTITPTTVLADLNEGAWDNYARVDWDVGTPATDGAGKASVDQQTALFTGPTVGGGLYVYGWYVTVYRGGTYYLWMAKNWDSGPKFLTDDTDVVAVVVKGRMFDAH